MNAKKNYVPAEIEMLLLAKEDVISTSNFLFSSNKGDDGEDEKTGKWYTPFTRF